MPGLTRRRLVKQTLATETQPCDCSHCADRREPDAVRADIELNRAVDAEAAFIMRTPVRELDAAEVTGRLDRASSVDLSYKTFAHRVYNKIAGAYHANGRHAAWFRSEIIPSS